MERKGDLPVDGHLVSRRAFSRLDPVVGDALGACLCLYCRIVRIEKNPELRLVQFLLVFDRCRALDTVSIVKQDAQITDTTNAGFRADGWLASLDAGIAEDAFFCLAGRPVVIDLLVRAAGDAHTPAAALIL